MSITTRENLPERRDGPAPWHPDFALRPVPAPRREGAEIEAEGIGLGGAFPRWVMIGGDPALLDPVRTRRRPRGSG